MANHKSAEKRIRQNEKRRLRNKRIRTAMRTVVKNCRTALEGSDVEDARAKFIAAERSLRRAASKGIVPKPADIRKFIKDKAAKTVKTTSAEL